MDEVFYRKNFVNFIFFFDFDGMIVFGDGLVFVYVQQVVNCFGDDGFLFDDVCVFIVIVDEEVFDGYDVVCWFVEIRGVDVCFFSVVYFVSCVQFVIFDVLIVVLDGFVDFFVLVDVEWVLVMNVLVICIVDVLEMFGFGGLFDWIVIGVGKFVGFEILFVVFFEDVWVLSIGDIWYNDLVLVYVCGYVIVLIGGFFDFEVILIFCVVEFLMLVFQFEVWLCG